MMLMARAEGDAGADARRAGRKVIVVPCSVTAAVLNGVVSYSRAWHRRAVAAASHSPVRAGERR
jgi:hypothetical protein